jgi:hypothetical protein
MEDLMVKEIKALDNIAVVNIVSYRGEIAG